MANGRAQLPQPFRWLPTAVALGVFALHAATVCPTVFFGDSGELIAASYTLGVAHPPGYPLYTLGGWLASHIPGIEPALGMNLMSAVAVALACGAVTRLTGIWTASPIGAAAAGLALGSSDTIWSIATVAEVYALHLLLAVLVLQAAERSTDRDFVVLGLTLGLGLAHRPTLALVALAALPLVRRLPSVKSLAAGSACAVLIPVVLYATLPLREAIAPETSWGVVEGLRSIWDHVSARAYRVYFVGADGWLDPGSWSRLGRVYLAQLGWAGTILAMIGLAGPCLVPRGGPFSRPGRVSSTLVLLAGLTTLFAAGYEADDVEVFLVAGLLALALATGIGTAWLATLGRWGRPLAAGTAALTLGAALVGHLRDHDLRGVTAAADYGRDVLASVPRDGTLFVDGDDAFILSYLIHVLGERPDLTVYSRNGTTFRNLLDEPDARPRPGESGFLAQMEAEQRRMLRAGGVGLRFLGWPGYEPPAGLQFEPVGLVYAVRPSGLPPLSDRALWDGYHDSSILTDSRRTGNAMGLTVSAFYPLMAAERQRYLGRHEAARVGYGRATEIAPRSETLWNYLGTLHGRHGDYPAAIEAFTRATQLKRLSHRAWNNLAEARFRSGDLAGARDAWVRSLEIKSDQGYVASRLRQLGIDVRGP